MWRLIEQILLKTFFIFCFAQPEVVIEMADDDVVAAGSEVKVEAGEPEVKKEDILKEDESEEEEEEEEVSISSTFFARVFCTNVVLAAFY
jgi:hypothetical protein